MNASRARRRWLKWCRYIDKTQSETPHRSYAGTHTGQAKAYTDVMFAHRCTPRGARVPWYPKWGSVDSAPYAGDQ